MKYILLASVIVLGSVGIIRGEDQQVQRPNILWISCEDISPHLGCFGDSNAITPNIDRLAAEGVRYTHTFTTAGVCAPCRSAIITGVYQSTLGTHHMRCEAKLPDFVKPFPVYLRESGYYCTNNSKQDYQFKTPKNVWDDSNRKAHWKNRQDASQPFFAVFNFTGCHESGISSESKYKKVTENLNEDQRQDPNSLTLPPYYPDTPIVREDWKRNYELITAMDVWAGELIQELKDAGEYENTIIFYWSDHGVGLPRAKRWLYDSGTRIPLVVRIPESFRVNQQGKPGELNDELVSSLDFAPTVLNLLGIPLPTHFQGRAFIGKNLTPPRDYVYGARDRMDERYDIIRAVRDKQFRYIRNYEPFKPYYQYMNTPEKGATMKELRRVHSEGQLSPAAAIFMAAQKPAEELYDLKADPHEIKNLAREQNYQDVLERMRTKHLEWVVQSRDIGLIPESEIQIREQKTAARYNILLNANADLIRRIRNVANLAVGGKENFAQLVAALDDEDAIVRYWASVGIGNLPSVAGPAKTKMKKALTDDSPCVRIAAARALLKLGAPELALPVLKKELTSEHQWGRLRAAIVLGEAGELARPLIPEMQACLKNQPNKYITRVANRTLNLLLGTDNAVK
ncbi:MAG: sulfatase-like hydrolase/transferase [Mariniblastus sp.]|nr:sulfatase-like hydrolase/transferase [Mariniblastus sp.]